MDYFAYPNDNGEVVVDSVALSSIAFGGIYSWRTWKDIKLDLGGKILHLRDDYDYLPNDIDHHCGKLNQLKEVYVKFSTPNNSGEIKPINIVMEIENYLIEKCPTLDYFSHVEPTMF